jgi:molecular chaperone GrpE (heat shock protein)
MEVSLIHEWGPSAVAFVGFTVNGLLILISRAHREGARMAHADETLAWRTRHEEEAHQRDQAISELKRISASLEAIVRSQGEQLKDVQQEFRDYRNRQERAS